MDLKTSAPASVVPVKERLAAAPLRWRYRRRQWVRLMFLAPAILYLIIFYGYPLYYSFMVSFEHYTLQEEVSGVAAFTGLANYVTVIRDPAFQLAAVHTLVFTFCSIIPQFLIGLGLALFFHRRFPLSQLLRSLMLVPWLLPIVVSATVWRWLFDETNGVIDQVLSGLHILPAHFGWLTTPHWAFAAVIVANIWIGIPFNMVILYSGLQGIPEEFYEAAAIDGASKWQAFLHVTIPLLEPVIGILLMLGLIYTLKVFDLIYVMTGGGPANDTQIFATWSYNLSFSQQLFGQGAATGNIILLIALAFALVYLWWARRTT
jgi:multiple sugar transport system permease protein